MNTNGVCIDMMRNPHEIMVCLRTSCFSICCYILLIVSEVPEWRAGEDILLVFVFNLMYPVTNLLST